MNCKCLNLFALLALQLLAGCGSPPTNPSAKQDDHGHAHASEGPHHGHLIEFGDEEYHGELTHDDATKTITVYLLGPDAKTAVTSSDTEIALNLVVNGEPLQAKLVAAPQEGEKAGEASRFTVVDEKVLEALEKPKTTGRVSVNIGGKSYTGTLDLSTHPHGHDHK